MSSPTEVVEKLPSTAELKEDVAKATKKSLQSLRDFAAGGVGGVFAVVVGHPFDLVKVRMQTAEKGVYSGAMDVAAAKAQGITPTYTIMINDTKPIWLYCTTGPHCASGMSMVINDK